MNALTERQLQILCLLARAEVEHRPCPTLREMGDATGISSTNGVADHLLRLERKGYVILTAMKTRSTRLTTAGRDRAGMAKPPLAPSVERMALLEDLYQASRAWEDTPEGDEQEPDVHAALVHAIRRVTAFDDAYGVAS